MHKSRLEAFSDGVLAIIITIMVLELRPPHEPTLQGLKPLLPVLGSYLLSFVYVAIYWNNHHHMLQSAKHVNGRVLWANMHLLFWLSLVPFATAWLGESRLQSGPAALYGIVMLGAAIAYYLLAITLVRAHGSDSIMATALGRDLKGKISPCIYALAIGLAYVAPAVACGLYVLVALIWLVPDTRFERAIIEQHRSQLSQTEHP
jgi:uncharacterized membrane protein